MLPNHPIPDSYWLARGQLLAGEYPGARSAAEARTKLGALLSAGVTLFFDLTEAGEYGLSPYTSLLAEEARRRGGSVEHRRRAIPDMGAPQPAEMAAMLDEIDAALAAGAVVYLHCYGGIGRTGTVAGCWLARHGLAGQEALTAIADLRRNTPDGHRASPETPAQRRMVLDWPVGS